MRSSISRSPSPGPSGDASLTAAWQTSIPISQTFPASAFPTSDELGFDTLDDLLEDIGLGNRMAYVVAQHLTQGSSKEAALTVEHGGPLAIRGTEGLVVAYGKCCYPLPGEPVVGHLSSGRGLVVHLEVCRNLAELRERNEALIPVRWAAEVDGVQR